MTKTLVEYIERWLKIMPNSSHLNSFLQICLIYVNYDYLLPIRIMKIRVFNIFNDYFKCFFGLPIEQR